MLETINATIMLALTDISLYLSFHKVRLLYKVKLQTKPRKLDQGTDCKINKLCQLAFIDSFSTKETYDCFTWLDFGKFIREI